MGLACAACFEELAGVFASSGALLYAKILASLKINSRGPAAKNILNRSRYPATQGDLLQNLLKTAIGLSALSELNQQISYLHKG